MAHEVGALAHEPHDHGHTGGYDDAHQYVGAHLHEDGSSHIHLHLHDHAHHDHHDAYRATGTGGGRHSHGHAHHHAHGHYYRVADGSAMDARMVSGEQARTRAYVSAAAFAPASEVEGQGLPAEQYRVSAGVETRLEAESATLAQLAQGTARPRGAFSMSARRLVRPAPVSGVRFRQRAS
jgi:hypothetical protein